MDLALPVGGSEDQCMEVESVGLPPEVAWKLFWIGWLHSSEVDDWEACPTVEDVPGSERQEGFIHTLVSRP